MKLAILLLLLASTAFGQSITPTNFFSYTPAWIAHMLGHGYVEKDTVIICIAPGTMEDAPAYLAELWLTHQFDTWTSVSFVVIPDGKPQM